MNSEEFETYCNLLQIERKDLKCDLESLNKVSVKQLHHIHYRLEKKKLRVIKYQK